MKISIGYRAYSRLLWVPPDVQSRMFHGEQLSKSKPLGIIFNSGGEPFTSFPKAEIHRLAGGHFAGEKKHRKQHEALLGGRSAVIR